VRVEIDPSDGKYMSPRKKEIRVPEIKEREGKEGRMRENNC